jgi:hypothetical protein
MEQQCTHDAGGDVFERCLACVTSTGVLLMVAMTSAALSVTAVMPVATVADTNSLVSIQSPDDLARREKAALDAWLDTVDSASDEDHDAVMRDHKTEQPATTLAPRRAEIVFASKPRLSSSPAYRDPYSGDSMLCGPQEHCDSPSGFRKDIPLMVLRVLSFDGTTEEARRNRPHSMALCALSTWSAPRVALVCSDGIVHLVSLGIIVSNAVGCPDNAKTASSLPREDANSVATVEWKTLKAQGTPGSLMHLLTSVAHNVQVPLVRTHMTSLSPDGGAAASGSRFLASLLFGGAPSVADAVPIVTPDAPLDSENVLDSDRESSGSRSSRQSTSTRTWRRGNRSARKHLVVVDASGADKSKGILEPVALSATDRMTLELDEMIARQMHQLLARDEPELRCQIWYDEAARWLKLFTELDGAYAKAAADDLRRRQLRSFISTVRNAQQCVVETDSFLPLMSMRGSQAEVDHIVTASARFLRLWRQRRSATVRGAPRPGGECNSLRYQSWLASYLSIAKDSQKRGDEIIPQWLQNMQDEDRCQFELADLELQHAQQLNSIKEVDDVVIAENQRSVFGASKKWEPFPSCPFQFLSGECADVAALNAQGSTGGKGAVWRWADVPAVTAAPRTSVLYQWEILDDWKYAAQWPTQEPGDADHWSLAEEDARATVRRRLLRRQRIDCQLEAEKLQLRKRLDAEMTTFRAQYGLTS